MVKCSFNKCINPGSDDDDVVSSLFLFGSFDGFSMEFSLESFGIGVFKDSSFSDIFLFVCKLEELNPEDPLYKNKPTFENVKFYDKLWTVKVRDLSKNGEEVTYLTPYVSVASGHHGLPIYAEFPGQETFPSSLKLIKTINIILK